MNGLIERLGKAGSRELDAEVAALIQGDGFKAVGEHVCGKGAFFSPDRYTTSLDAALALAERLNLNGPLVIHRNGPAEWGATYVDDDTVYARTPALALCIAILKAEKSA